VGGKKEESEGGNIWKKRWVKMWAAGGDFDRLRGGGEKIVMELSTNTWNLELTSREGRNREKCHSCSCRSQGGGNRRKSGRVKKNFKSMGVRRRRGRSRPLNGKLPTPATNRKQVEV